MAKIKKITIIHADKRQNTVIIQGEPRLEQLQKWVGGYIELIPFFKHFEGERIIWAYSNEMGRLENLPLNEQATLGWHNSLQKLGIGLTGEEWLCGDIVIIQSLKPEV